MIFSFIGACFFLEIEWLGTVYYLRAGAGDFEGFMASRRWGGTYFWYKCRKLETVPKNFYLNYK